MTQRFWPVSILGGCALFMSGAFSTMSALWFISGSIHNAIIDAVLAGILFVLAAESAKQSLMFGTYRVGWFGIRSIEHTTETEIKKVEP